MNWLIISSEKENSQKVINTLNELFEGSVFYESSTKKSDLRKFYDILSEITACIVLTEKFSSGVELICGYLCGKNVPVITCAKIDDEVKNCFERLYAEENIDSICDNLRKTKSQFIQEVQQKEAYDYLFEHGIPFSPDHFSKYVQKGELEICECYLVAGMDINSRDKDGTPMLNLACRNDKIDVVKWLCDKGAELNVVSEDRGYTPLMDAVWRGNKEITEYLISKGSDVNVISKEGQTMIILSVGADNIEITRILAENGADVDICDGMGMSAYGYASLFKKTELLSILEKYHKEV